jgi:hypothetical protein
MARAVWGRVLDALYAASDVSHRARGWEVRKGRFGSRSYRLNVAAWLESQRRAEQFGSTPGPVVLVRDEAADLWDSMRWTEADIASALGQVARQARRTGIALSPALGNVPVCRVVRDGQEAA